MFRIDGPGAVGELPSVREGVNSPGYFSGGDPATGRAATRVTYEWLNAVQEELGNVIRAAGIELDKHDSSQLLAALAVLAAAPGDIIPPDNETITIRDGRLSVPIDEKTLQIKDGKLTAVGGASSYKLCNVYPFLNPTLEPGFQPCQGGLIANANIKYPEAWAYLQTEEGQKMCVTEEAWQAMTQTTWGDGKFKGNWDGIGGAPRYVQDLEAGTLRMPDLRGMVEMAAADGTIGPRVGEAVGDRIREISGSFTLTNAIFLTPTGVFSGLADVATSIGGDREAAGQRPLFFKASTVVPTGPVVSPRAYGVLTCAYLGQPAAA